LVEAQQHATIDNLIDQPSDPINQSI